MKSRNCLQLGATVTGGLAQLFPTSRRLYRLPSILKRERAGHTLQTSALVNEAYIRLIDWKTARFESRAHFYGVSAQLMRRILVDFARRRPRPQGGMAQHVALDEALLIAAEPDADLVALDEALETLAQHDARKARIVELRFFGVERGRDGGTARRLAGDGAPANGTRRGRGSYRELSTKEKMQAERWQEIDQLFDARWNARGGACSFLAAACAGDDELRREVESLLEAYERLCNFIEAPAVKWRRRTPRWRGPCQKSSQLSARDRPLPHSVPSRRGRNGRGYLGKTRAGSPRGA